MLHKKNISLNAILSIFLGLFLVVLTGCKTASYTNQGSNPIMVGPGFQQTLRGGKKTYTYNSNIYLDVVVPIFNPGIPVLGNGEVDYDEVDEEGIWPQLRHAEATRFAIQTKKALEDIGSFGSVSVVPTQGASGDIYVLGSIDHSDSEIVKLTATIIDSSGAIWGKKQFKHQVSKGFFRDVRNKGKDPYFPVFRQVSRYVYDLLRTKTEQQKQAIKNLTTIRYAQYYSPESYDQYVQHKVVSGIFEDHYEFRLVGMPSKEDRMMQRINTLRNQEQLFVDRLQDQYLAFDIKTEEHYRAWQEETLPEAVAARDAKNKRNLAVAGSVALTAMAIMFNRKDNSMNGTLGTVASGAGAVFLAKTAMEKNEQLKIHKESLDEIGENLDVAMGPSVMKLDDKMVELTGTAAEQYEQWKAHLRNTYELESGNVQML